MQALWENLWTSLAVTLIISICSYFWARVRTIKFEKFLEKPQLKILELGRFDYLKGHGIRFDKINNGGQVGHALNWTISDAIGALDKVRDARVEAQKNFRGRVFYNNEIMELEATEKTLIMFLVSIRPNIQDKNI